jgi:hypothetical protein
MVIEAPSTVRARRLRERRSRGVAMVASVEVGEGGQLFHADSLIEFDAGRDSRHQGREPNDRQVQLNDMPQWGANLVRLVLL